MNQRKPKGSNRFLIIAVIGAICGAICDGVGRHLVKTGSPSKMSWSAIEVSTLVVLSVFGLACFWVSRQRKR